jgi:carbonyl reductase 1
VGYIEQKKLQVYISSVSEAVNNNIKISIRTTGRKKTRRKEDARLTDGSLHYDMTSRLQLRCISSSRLALICGEEDCVTHVRCHPAINNMSNVLTIVVTGSNRGIGYGIIQLLAKTKHQPPLLIYATSRSGANLAIEAGHDNKIHYSELDVGNKDSITSFLRGNNQSIDVLINNAGINNNNEETPDLAAETIDVNYRGTRDTCQQFLEQGGMRERKGARIVNVSSTACQLSNYAPGVQEKFRSVKSVEDVDKLAGEYEAAVRAGGKAQQEEGWGSGPKSYQVSKALVNALTVVLAENNADVLVNCCCPGW